MEILQIILIIALILLIISLTAVSLYSIFVLKDLKDVLQDAKVIIKTGKNITSSLVIPLTAVMGLAGGLSKGLKAVKSISSMFADEDGYDDEEEI
jgi:hypothetical protein